MGFTRKFEEFNAIIYQKDKLNQLSVIKESFLYTTFTVDAVDRLVDRGIVKAKAERIAKEISEELNGDSNSASLGIYMDATLYFACDVMDSDLFDKIVPTMNKLYKRIEEGLYLSSDGMYLSLGRNKTIRFIAIDSIPHISITDD
jgi:hypothetical protein